MIFMESSDLADGVVVALNSVLGESTVALHEPCFEGREWVYLKECLDSTFVSSVGPFVDRFEQDLASYTGSRFAVAVVNGTAALHIALELAGVKESDEVLIPALTFIATANAVSYCNATPHLVDCEEDSLGIDPVALRDYLSEISEIKNDVCINKVTGKVIRAVVPMHTFGHVCNIESIMAIAEEYKLKVIEDAAESLGSTRCGRHAGTFGSLGAVSFNGNKILTTGGGGAILTNDEVLAKRAKHLTTTAKVPHPWNYKHDEVGYNYRMPNINAALGCAQLEKLEEFISIKRKIYDIYSNAFRTLEGVSIFSEPHNARSNYWLQVLLLDKDVEHFRDQILKATNDKRYMTRPVWALIHHQVPYCGVPRMELSVAESLERRLINLPSGVAVGR